MSGSRVFAQKRVADRGRAAYSSAPALPSHLQRKAIAIGAASDPFEREAERAADHVMSGAAPRIRNLASPGHVQPACAACSAGATPCSKCQAAASHDREPAPRADGSVSHAPRIVSDVLRSPGEPLAASTRAFFEPRFGHDFSRVRVHADAQASESARAIQAAAYTVGHDVVFQRDRYAPSTSVGRHLLAHELSHVIQQAGGTRGPIVQRQADTTTTPAASTPIVYMCSKNLQSSPVGKHAFFRIGGAGSGNPTRSLEPVDRGNECFQGQPMYDFPEDFNAKADCEATAITPSCLAAQFTAYPIGQYCTLGPNSNTFVGTLARNCGLSDPDPPGWTPGIDDRPPHAGTFAPAPFDTLVNCSQKICDASRDPDPGEGIPA